MVNLGWCYLNGYGTYVNEIEAFKWFLKSATSQDECGMNWLGWCYEHGIGTSQSESFAFKLYEKSARLGSPYGMKNLSRCYENGIGTEQDKEQALYWKKKAEETEAQDFDDKNPVM